MIRIVKTPRAATRVRAMVVTTSEVMENHVMISMNALKIREDVHIFARIHKVHEPVHAWMDIL